MSPVSFEVLNEAIAKGKGLPDLSTKKDVMADGNSMTAALFLAPVAGVVGAVSRYLATMKRINAANELKIDEGGHES